jgi:glycine cleavage system aminomethyltransferase T
MTIENLEAAIQRVGNPVELLRNSQYPAFEFPITAEFTNWRSEQMAWRETCVLMDQSHHMSNLFLKGPDALRLLSEHGVNTFAKFTPGMAKQYVAVNEDGQFVGDGILFFLDEAHFDLVANPSVINWVQFHLESGGYDATAERDDNSNRRLGPPKLYRYEIQGPNAGPLVEKLIGRSLPQVKFFSMTDLTIAGIRVRALRHGMAGQPGFEIFGPWTEGKQILETILAAGEAFGLKRAGAKAYATANLESGWIPRPMTAIFGPHEKAYRQWLRATAVGSLGGSMDSRNISDYYHTPYDIGYGRLVNLDHDFVGRKALEEIAKHPRRTKVTLAWNVEDVTSAIRSHYEPGLPAKYIEIPKARYAYFQVDKILHKGKYAGMSTDVGYITNERAFISLASIDAALSSPGTEVTVLWGEKPNSAKPAVEPHRQVEIRATVAPVPYAQVIRESYRKSGTG